MKEVVTHDRFSDDRRAWRPGASLPAGRADAETIPLLYTVSMLTVLHGWYRTHTVLADRILFALVGLVVLSWLLSLIRFVCDLVMQARDDAAAMEYFSYRVRKARENGEDTVSTEGLWR